MDRSQPLKKALYLLRGRRTAVFAVAGLLALVAFMEYERHAAGQANGCTSGRDAGGAALAPFTHPVPSE